MNITELKALAEKATPGPWRASVKLWEDAMYANVYPERGSVVVVGQKTNRINSKSQKRANDVFYVAAANPAAILELIAQLEDAKGEIRALLATEQNLREELEIERVRLAACGVVAMSNTRESAAKARKMLPQYESASCRDVARAVDAEMDLRERVKELEAAIGGLLVGCEYRSIGGEAPAWHQKQMPSNAALDRARALLEKQQ